MNIGDKVLKTLGKQAFTILLCMAWVLTASAQHTVESIRKEYQSVHEWITLMSDNFPSDGIPPEYFDLRVVQNLPATGPHHENIRMYYGELEPEEEGGGDIWPYELRMWFDGQCLLRFNAKKFEGPLDYLDIATLKKGTFKDEYTGKTIPKKFVSEADRCKQGAQRYQSLFKSIDNR